MGTILIIPIAAAIAVMCKRKIEETIFPAICLIILILMCFGVFDYLKLGLYSAWVLLFPCIFILYFRKSEIKDFILTPGFYAFIIYYFLFWVLTQGFFFTSDNSLSKYGPQLLNIYKTDSLRNNNLYYNLNTPFPFVSLWSYFVEKSGKSFDESKSIFSCSIFIISALLPLFSYIKNIKKEKLKYLIILLLCLFLPIFKIKDAYISFDMAIPQATALVYCFLILYRIIFLRFYKNTKVDYFFLGIGIFASCTITEYGVLTLLPILFGINIIAIYDILRSHLRKNNLYLLASLTFACVLTLIWNIYRYVCEEISFKKLIFIPFVFLAVMILSLCVSLGIYLYEMGNKISSILLVFILFALIIIAFIYMIKRSIYCNYAIEELLEYTDKLFLGDGSIIIGDVSEKEYVIGNKYFKLYDITMLFTVVMINGFVCKCQRKKSIEKYNLSYRFSFGITIGLILYLMSLAILYINVIREPKGFPVPTISSYMTPIIMLAFVYFVVNLYDFWKKEIVIYSTAVFLLLCVIPYVKKIYFEKPVYNNAYPLIAECKENGKIELTGKDRIFYIDRDLLEPIPKMFAWTVYPAGANSISGMYYNPEPYKWSDIERTMTAEEFEVLITEGGYTYVYIKNVDDYFITTYYPDFDNWGLDIQNDALYRVEYNDNGQLQIKLIAKEKH